jgi:prevent-host-death family protein
MRGSHVSAGVVRRESYNETRYVTFMNMKEVSIKDLKAHLSAVVEQAQAGRTIVITRHNAPVAQLGPARADHVHRGTRVGSGPVRAALKRVTRGRYLSVLLEDRGER